METIKDFIAGIGFLVVLSAPFIVISELIVTMDLRTFVAVCSVLIGSILLFLIKSVGGEIRKSLKRR